MSEFRQDPITGRWAIVAENRSLRPDEYAVRPPVSNPAGCPFCEGNEAKTPSEIVAYREPRGVANGPGWTVRTIPNKFPTLAGNVPPEGGATSEPGEERAPGVGRHEVIIASPAHTPLLADLPDEQVRRVLRMLRERVAAHAGSPGIGASLAFENCGPESGGSLYHPHLQVVSLPPVPPLLREESDGLDRWARTHGGGCGLEWVVSHERAAAHRMLHEDSLWSAFAPFASGHPFEMRLVPRRHAASLADGSDAEIDALGRLLPALLRALQAVAPGASYNFVSSSFATRGSDAMTYHWHLDILPRIVRPDGFDVGGGIAVNPVAPESAAEALRSALERARRSAETSEPPRKT